MSPFQKRTRIEISKTYHEVTCLIELRPPETDTPASLPELSNQLYISQHNSLVLMPDSHRPAGGQLAVLAPTVNITKSMKL